jgi:hypothetical protein
MADANSIQSCSRDPGFWLNQGVVRTVMKRRGRFMEKERNVSTEYQGKQCKKGQSGLKVDLKDNNATWGGPLRLKKPPN